MTRREYQVALIRILVEIDQRVAREEGAAFRPELTCEQREIAVARLELARNTADQVGIMLHSHNPPRER